MQSRLVKAKEKDDDDDLNTVMGYALDLEVPTGNWNSVLAVATLNDTIRTSPLASLALAVTTRFENNQDTVFSPRGVN